jgi:hypothetical protein
MPDADIEDKVELYEHFFRDPQVGEAMLQPAHAGIACRNIRDALRLLDHPVARGDVYDDELTKAVLSFQIKYKHDKQDGLVGPGTRKLLTRVVIGKGREWFFKRGRISPEYAIFISYSRKDENLLAGMVNGIRSQGIPVFRDKEAILGGASWPDVLYRSIRKCQVFLCVLSPYSAASINVFIELALARHSDRPIVPVLLQAVELPAAMQALIGDIQYIDLEGKVGSKEGTDELLQALSAHGLFPQPQQLHSQE